MSHLDPEMSSFTGKNIYGIKLKPQDTLHLAIMTKNKVGNLSENQILYLIHS